jgi:hypothetical protein
LAFEIVEMLEQRAPGDPRDAHEVSQANGLRQVLTHEAEHARDVAWRDRMRPATERA